MLGAFMYFCIWLPLNVLRRIWWNWQVEGLEHLPPRAQGMVYAPYLHVQHRRTACECG